MSQVWARQALLPDGWAENVLVEIDEAGRIAKVQVGTTINGVETAVLLPAPVNVHSHAFQRAMAGLTERMGPDRRDSFWTWRELMYRFLDRLTPENVESIAAFVQMEMLEAGYGTNAEFHYLHHQRGGAHYSNIAEMSERICAGAEQTGIGLCMLPVLYQYGGCDGREVTTGQRRFRSDWDAFAAIHDGTRSALRTLPADAGLGAAPHSLRAVGKEDLGRFSQEFGGGPVHMHLAEQLAEVDEVKETWGARPVEWALDNLAIDQRWCLIHCTQMEQHETRNLAATGAVAGLCPITESNLGDGIFDGVNWMESGGAIAIGSDSNVRISLTEELRTLEYSQRLRDRSRAALATPEKSTGRRLFDAIVAGGARATGRATGEIKVGAWADLLALDDSGEDQLGVGGDLFLDTWVFCGDDSLVRDVWAAGRHVVKNGRHVRRDEISRAYRNTLKTLRDAI